jgi:hypothetical protein
MPVLPNAASAIFDIRKLEDYCLDPSHPRGRHKARVFRDALGLSRQDAAGFVICCWTGSARLMPRKLRATVSGLAGGLMFRSRDKIAALW